MNQLILSIEAQRKLLSWAKQEINFVVCGLGQANIDTSDLSDDLLTQRGAFVTLRKKGELRGCIGKMDYDRPLWRNVLDAAISSALEDPRFPPLQQDEIGEVKLEISVVGSPVDLTSTDHFNPQQLGIIIEKGLHRGLLLPKVAQEHGWDAQQTFEAVCVKAGLPSNAWQEPGTRLRIFNSFDFSEASNS